MSTFSRILFPVDFSPRCHAARPLVAAMAQKLGAKVTLLYAIQLPQNLFALERSYPIEIDTEHMCADARDELRRFYGPGDVDVAAEIGDVALAITTYAAGNNVDLIMMPTHGYGKFRGLLLGSITAKVLHDATCPVWTAAHSEEVKMGAHGDSKSILCALDLEKGSLELLRQAVDFASSFDAKLRIVHAVPDAAPGPDVAAYASTTNFLAAAAQEELARLQEEAGTKLDVCLGVMPVASWIREVAMHHAADLVIAGRGTLQSNLGRLRTNAYSIIREAPCPVLSF
jgi:nucleotide-binding universal stress UspA family protein